MFAGSPSPDPGCILLPSNWVQTSKCLPLPSWKKDFLS